MTPVVGTNSGVVVLNEFGLCAHVAFGFRVLTSIGSEMAEEVLVHDKRFFGTVQAIVVLGVMGRLLRVESVPEEWIVLGFDRANKWSGSFIVGVHDTGKIIEVSDTIISKESVRIDTIVMVIEEHGFIFINISDVTKGTECFGDGGATDKGKRKTDLFGSDSVEPSTSA